jgi:hypothetical protein
MTRTYRLMLIGGVLTSAAVPAASHGSVHLPAAESTAVSAGAMPPASAGPRLAQLTLLGPNHPRVFHFRGASEGAAANPQISYEQWKSRITDLMGVIGKALDEEIPGRSARNPEFYSRFKREHPEKLVLLHVNGNARDPRFDSGGFFAGHWLHFPATRILGDVPAEEGETTIAIADSRYFETGIGRYRNASVDIALCAMNADGTPNWHESEQVQLIAVDPAKGTARVRRGQYGTVPRAFAGDKALAAVHLTEGPWGERSHLMWLYNFSTHGPRDSNGRSCIDVLVEDLGNRFLHGELRDFDGMEFDVLHDRTHPAADTTGDGRGDGGRVRGVNVYGAGVVEFCRRLREKLGPDRIIQADGATSRPQRAFGLLNGIESEGWPSNADPGIKDWSGAMNRFAFWDAHAFAPAFSYSAHKYTEGGGDAVNRKVIDVPAATHRLVFAGNVISGAAVSPSLLPPPERDGMRIWDELVMGRERRLGWLGAPVSSPVRLAMLQPDRLEGAGAPVGAAFVKRLHGPEAHVELVGNEVRLSRTGSAQSIAFMLRDVPVDGPELFVSVIARAAPMAGHPANMARLMYVGVTESDDLAAAIESWGDYRRIKRSFREDEPERFMAWVGSESFESGFAFSEIRGRRVNLVFLVESGEPVWLSRVTAHAHPDAMYREFEHGLVLANPSPRPHAFDLASIAPGATFRRLHGSSKQDPATNNGHPVAGRVRLEGKDGLFLVRTGSR